MLAIDQRIQLRREKLLHWESSGEPRMMARFRYCYGSGGWLVDYA